MIATDYADYTDLNPRNPRSPDCDMMRHIVLTLRTRHEIDLGSGRITRPRSSPQGNLLAIPTDSGLIAVLDLESGSVVNKLGPHSGAVTAVTWGRTSECLLSSSLDGSVGHWEVKTGMRGPFTITGHTEPVRFVEWTDEEAFAMTCSTDRVRAWDGCCLLPGWDKDMEERANKHTEFTVASCSNRTSFLLAMAAEKGTVLLLANLLSADILDSVEMNELVRCLAWSPADELLAVGGARSTWIFRASHEGFNESHHKLSEQCSDIQSLAFSGDGTLLACRDSQGLKVWDVETLKLVGELQQHNRTASGLAFHPEEPLLATSNDDATKLHILELT
jgi:WD40 repeat protein